MLVKNIQIYAQNKLASFFYHLGGAKKLLTQYVRQYLIKYPVELVGIEWECGANKPIGIFIGFNHWKRQDTAKLFSEYRCAFVHGHAWFFRVLRNFVWELPENSVIHYVVWGKKEDAQFGLYVKWCRFLKKEIKILRVEDGFVRSIGSGLLHTKACSICVDKSSIYFDAEKSSDLENILNYDGALEDPALLSRAADCVKIFKAARVSKYYPLEPYDTEIIVRSGCYSVLVIGQVEDDASIKFGNCKIKRNNDLVIQARKENPNADIFFRPHPDYFHETRRAYTNSKYIENICTIVPPTMALHKLLEQVDHVYTMTSLSGFEALLYGKKVTCFGAPFYAGWGLTDDRVKSNRRTRRLNLEQLFAGAYLIYPRYVHPESDKPSSFEEVVSFFVVEVLKYDNLFFLDDKYRTLYEMCVPYANNLGTPFKILHEIIKSGNFAALENKKFWSVLTKKFDLHDYSQVSYLLAKSSNYDLLVDLSNKCLTILDENRSEFRSNTSGIESFLYSLRLNMAKTNGRVINKLPNFNREILRLFGSDKNSKSIIRNYVHALSNNLQYEYISQFIDGVENYNKINQVNYLFSRKKLVDYIRDITAFKFDKFGYKDVLEILSQKPTRSERNGNFRHQLKDRAKVTLNELLESEYQGTFDSFINSMLVFVYASSLYDAQKSLKVFLNACGKYNEGMLLPDFAYLARSNDLIYCAQFFAKKADAESVWKILELLDLIDERDIVNVKLQLYSKTKNWDSFFYEYNNIDSSCVSETANVLYARSLREHGFLQKAILLNKEILNKSRTLAKRSSVSLEIERLEFLLETSSIINSIPQPKLPTGVVLLTSQTCFNTLAMVAPVLCELKKLGYAVVNICAGMTIDQKTGIDYIDQFSAIMPLDLTNYEIENKWYVDWKSKEIISDGVNYYQGFYEGLSGYSRRFFVDINETFVNNQFQSQLKRSDLCLSICKKILTELVGRGVRTVLLSGNSHVTPFSVFRDYAIAKQSPLLSFINCNASYESYYSNLGSKFANTMCVTDMTQHPHLRAPFLARADQFEPWFKENKSNEHYIAKTRSLLSLNRVGSDSDETERKIIDYILNCKSKGMKILCAFGKVPVDLNVPFDGGPAHRDMSDWITHTVETVGKSDNLILFVKPHPHELRPEISLDLVESFHDLIKTPIPKNVILLNHKDINGHSLAPHLDLALLYNGSSGIELAAQGVPVCMASYFGKYDYPVDLIYPESRDNYEKFLLCGDYEKPDTETRIRSAFLLCFLGAGQISAENKYSIRPITNDKIGVPIWRKELINQYFRNGDVNMEKIANIVINKTAAVVSKNA